MSHTRAGEQQTVSIFVSCIACLTIVSTLGCQPGQQVAPGPVAVSSPQAVYNTARDAFVAQNFEAFTECFTPGGVDELAGGLRILGGIIYVTGSAAESDDQTKALAQAIKSTLDKYLPPDPPEVNLDLNLPPAEVQAQVQQVGHALSDRPAFVAAFFQALLTHATNRPDFAKLKEGRLDDLNIDGDSATATISAGFLDGRPTPVTFRKHEGEWKIDSMGQFGVSR